MSLSRHPGPDEIICGDPDIVVLPVDRPIMLRQSRSGPNPVQPQLVDSIETSGLQELPKIAAIGKSLFKLYLEFTQEKMGEERDISDFRTTTIGNHKVFPLVLSGHSRVLAMQDIHGRLGTHGYSHYSLSYPEDPATIIERQIAANVHARPDLDDEARTWAGAFEFALHLDPTLTRKGFSEKHGLRTDFLYDALYYVELPAVVQASVKKRDLPFGLAVQMAKIMELNKQYFTIFGAGPDENVEEAVRLEMVRYTNLYSDKKSIDKVLSWIRNDRKAKMDQLLQAGYTPLGSLKPQKVPEGPEQLTMTVATVHNERYSWLKRTVDAELRDMLSRRTAKEAGLLRMSIELLGMDDEFTLLGDDVRAAAAKTAEELRLIEKRRTSVTKELAARATS